MCERVFFLHSCSFYRIGQFEQGSETVKQGENREQSQKEKIFSEQQLLGGKNAVSCKGQRTEWADWWDTVEMAERKTNNL